MISAKLSRAGAPLLAALLVLALAASPAAAQNFSRYVALGDSLTAAFASGGLLDEVQQWSYPALIKQQTSGGAFEQPTVSSPGIPPLLDLVSLSPLIIAPRSAQNGVPTNLFLPRPYDNLAVPGFRVRDVLVSPANNGLVDLILRPAGFGGASALEQALFLQPTFVTLWIGNNDVLGAATSGIVIDGVTLTPLAQFEADYRTIVGAIAASGAGLAVANIPDVTSLPFVTTLPPFVINPATQQPVLVNGQLVPIIGPDGPLGPGDFVLLTASTPLSRGIGIPTFLGGTGQPLGTQYVLSASEVATIRNRTAAYNQVIAAVANQAGAALVDINSIFGQVAATGIDFGGIDYNADFLTGGVFSYDGVHPAPFGYAFAANEFIKAINDRFSASIPQLDLFPFTFGTAGTAGSGLTPAEAKGAIFSQAAAENLRQTLRVPSTEALLSLLDQGGNPGRGPGDRPGNGPGAGPGGDPGAGPGQGPAAPGTPSLPERPARPGQGG